MTMKNKKQLLYLRTHNNTYPRICIKTFKVDLEIFFSSFSQLFQCEPFLAYTVKFEKRILNLRVEI